jgi:DNA-directed RNA polymerase subunit H (RpoH/RPB5)
MLDLLLEKYGVTFENLPRSKQKNVVADALSRLGTDSHNIQEE